MKITPRIDQGNGASHYGYRKSLGIRRVVNSFLNRLLIRVGGGVTRGYKDGLQPETLADGNWLVKQNQPVSRIKTKSDKNLGSLYE